MAVKSRTLPLSKRGLNFEMFMWLFTRPLRAGDVWVDPDRDHRRADHGRAQPNESGRRAALGVHAHQPHVQSTDVPDLAPWSTPFWRVDSQSLLLLAVAHGVHGLVVIADDYIDTARGRQIIRILSIIMIISMSLIGLYVIWTS